ncbi:ALF repeat-containing protein [Streptomyces olivoreticuli]|uniref:ALF repeat-containing protein n=1 Tax=Streptomyces olivoreticuli TaxID=68246 RepID=UPI00265ACD5A|nr:ALF repeat-containing protein [Streptomyces olivoreticuli]WKK26302.1 ALF repeat-containing protein [Streptomyces olivoreticuli]
MARVSAVVVAAAIAPAVLLSSPAFAVGGAAKSPAAVSTAQQGETVKVSDMSVDDLRVAVLRLMANGGRAVKAAGNDALNGTVDDLRRFLEVGQFRAREEDDRVEALTIMFKGGRAVKAAGDKALKGTAADVRRFIEVGQFRAREEDDRVEALTIMFKGGQAVKAAGDKALKGTAADVRRFIEVGQYEARKLDEQKKPAVKKR